MLVFTLLPSPQPVPSAMKPTQSMVMSVTGFPHTWVELTFRLWRPPALCRCVCPAVSSGHSGSGQVAVRETVNQRTGGWTQWGRVNEWSRVRAQSLQVVILCLVGGRCICLSKETFINIVADLRPLVQLFNSFVPFYRQRKRYFPQIKCSVHASPQGLLSCLPRAWEEGVDIS